MSEQGILRERIEDYLRQKGIPLHKAFRCLNPVHEDVHPSMRYNRKNGTVHCFSCGATYDLFDLVGLDYGLERFPERLEQARALFLARTENVEPQRQTVVSGHGPELCRVRGEDRMAFAEKGRKSAHGESSLRPMEWVWGEDLAGQPKGRLEGFPYLASRGIDAELCVRYGIWEDAEYAYFPVTEQGAPVGWCARRKDGAEPRYRNAAGPMGLWNGDLIRAGGGGPVFVTEGVLDALALEMMGHRAVALCGSQGTTRLLGLCGEEPDRARLFRFVLCGDGDEAGWRMNRSLAAGLAGLGIAHTVLELPEGADVCALWGGAFRSAGQGETGGAAKEPPVPDPGEEDPAIPAGNAGGGFSHTGDALYQRMWLHQAAAAAVEALADAGEGAVPREETSSSKEKKQPPAAEMAAGGPDEPMPVRVRSASGQESGGLPQADSLSVPAAAGLGELFTKRHTAAATGLAGLDRLLEGGLYSGLAVLGGISSAGKTSLALQIADTVAAQGRDVLYVTLEQSREELIAKSLSRASARLVGQSRGFSLVGKGKCETGGSASLTARELLRGVTEPDRLLLLERAREDYRAAAEHLYVLEGVADVGTAEIRAAVERHRERTGIPPVVVVDYLQILKPADPRATDKQNTDRAVVALKRISREFDIPVLAVSSFNRENYRAAVSMESFKESGAVEYSSDLLLGLQLTGAGEPGFDVNAAKLREPREVELVVLKNRNGVPFAKLRLRYFARWETFLEK